MKNLENRLSFAQTLVRSAKLTIGGFENRLHEITKARESLDKREAQLRKDFAAAPARLKSAQAQLDGLMVVERQLKAAGGDEGGRKVLEAKMNKRERLREKLRLLEEEIAADV